MQGADELRKGLHNELNLIELKRDKVLDLTVDVTLDLILDA